jgi:hypothetical protein
MRRKTIPFKGRWILLSREPKHPLPENFYSLRVPDLA